MSDIYAENHQNDPEPVMDGPCQLCMSGSTFGIEKAQYLLLDGQWHPWPLVAARPEAPMIRLRCHICDPEGYREDAAEMNARIAAAQASN